MTGFDTPLLAAEFFISYRRESSCSQTDCAVQNDRNRIFAYGHSRNSEDKIVRCLRSEIAFSMPQADTVFVNGRIVTVNSTDDVTEALSIRRNRILRVGDSCLR